MFILIKCSLLSVFNTHLDSHYREWVSSAITVLYCISEQSLGMDLVVIIQMTVCLDLPCTDS